MDFDRVAEELWRRFGKSGLARFGLRVRRFLGASVASQGVFAEYVAFLVILGQF